MKKIRLKSILAVAMFCTAIFLPGCKDDEEKASDMRSNMTAMDYAQEMGVGINLGNTFDAFWEDLSNETSGAQLIGENTPQNYETCWGGIETTKECIKGMHKEGFNTVRVPVYWGNMMENDSKYTINKEYMKRVKEVVDYCYNDGLYVVVNMHHYDAFLIKNKEKDEVLKATAIVWEQIANEFKDYSDYLVFEGFNEALGSQPEGSNLTEEEIYSYVNDMNQVFVDTVRKTGGNNTSRVLIASGYWTNIDNTTKPEFVMPKDSAKDRLMVSVHYIDNACYWTNQIGGDYWLNYSKEQCELLKAAFTDKKIPVFVGECTGIYDAERFQPNASITQSSECLSTILNMAADYGFVPVIWDVNDGFYSRTECKIKSDSDKVVITALAEKIKNK